MDSRLYSWVLFTPAIGLWSASLFQPALKQPGGGPFNYTGMYCLMLGWIGILGKPQWAVPWSANVLYWIGLGAGLFRRHPSRETLLLTLAAIPLTLVALVNRSIEMNEGGAKSAVVPGSGFYLWLGSMVALAAALYFRTERGL